MPIHEITINVVGDAAPVSRIYHAVCDSCGRRESITGGGDLTTPFGDWLDEGDRAFCPGCKAVVR